MLRKTGNAISDGLSVLFEAIVGLFTALFTVLYNLPWIIIIPLILVGALIFFPVSCGIKYFSADREGPWYDDYALTFVRGDIDELGTVDDGAKNALYTKDMIECDEFRITLKYGSDYYCEIHYFTADDRWLSFEIIKNSGTHSVLSLQMPDQTAGIRLVLVRNDEKNIAWFSKESAVSSIVLDVYREPEPTEAATDAAA